MHCGAKNTAGGGGKKKKEGDYQASQNVA